MDVLSVGCEKFFDVQQIPATFPVRQSAAAPVATQDVTCWIWYAYLIANPFYLFESGTPQLADYLIVTLSALIVLSRRVSLPASAMAYVRGSALMVGWFVFVNLFRSLQLGVPSPNIYSLYYVFIFLSTIGFLSLYQQFGELFLRRTLFAVFASVGLQLALCLHDSLQSHARTTLFFNNPNQLAYYLLLFASLFWLLTDRVQRIRHWWIAESVFYLGCVYVALQSLSRSALAALGMLLCLRLFSQARASMILIISIAGLVAMFGNLTVLDSLHERITRKQFNFAEEQSYRGYDRISNHPGYLWFGAGEGVTDRFVSQLEGEMHSSVGTVLFSYGVPGLMLFIWLIVVAARRNGLRGLLYILPALAYGLTHNGLRQIEFWIILAAIATLPALTSHGSQAAARQFSNERSRSSSR